MEGHEREEAEVGGHGDTAAAVLRMRTCQPGTLPPLLWGDGVLGHTTLSGSLRHPLPCPPAYLPTHQPSCMGTLLSSSRW